MKLHINNFSVYGPNGLLLVDKVSMCLSSGKIYLIQGRNGSGKSSLVSGLMAHPKYKTDCIQYEIDGVSLAGAKVDDIARAGIFLAAQHVPEVEGLRVIQVLYAAYVAQGGEKDILSFKDDLVNTLLELQMDISFLERDLFFGFSGGEKKMLQCIFALALKPKFAIFDEIDSGVDNNAISQIYSALLHLKSTGTGILLISHNSDITQKLPTEYVFEFEDKTIKNPNVCSDY